MASYFEQCVQASQSIDIDALQDAELGAEIGRGQHFATHRLGVFTVDSMAMHLAIKVPIAPQRPEESQAEYGQRMVQRRLSLELGAMNDLVDRVPSLRPTLPHLLTPVACSDSSLVGILTEDVSFGGARNVVARRDAQLEQQVRQAYAQNIAEDGEDILCPEAFGSMAFWDGARTRLLDFTPPPIWPGQVDLNEGYTGDLEYDVIRAGILCCTLDINSQLAQDCRAKLALSLDEC